MLRDFKFLRRNSSKNPNTEEIENVPVNPRDSLGPKTLTDASRPPLYTIQEPTQNCKASVEQEVGIKVSKIASTPTKSKVRHSDAGMPFRTPEKQGITIKNRFGWASKNDSRSHTTESHDESRSQSHMTTPPRSTRRVGRPNSSYSECNSTQSTPTKSVTKPPNPAFCLASGSRPPQNGGVRVANFAALSKGIPSTCSSLTVVNTVEVPHFDLNVDPSFWMEHNVQVLIRIRPLNNMEKGIHGYSRCLKQDSAQCITWIGQPETRFTFDHVACEMIDQETLFKMIGLPMVENCLAGYNSCMFAYGQTGSGKTYTMLGEVEELEIKPSPKRGMTPRIFEFLFARIREEEERRRSERLQYSCKCSFLEIYNEQITDLLDPSSTNLQLREDIKNGVYVENLSEFEVQTVGDILKLLTQGSSNRKVAATNMNRESSRSHSVFTCVIESRWEKDSTSNLRYARLNLVDLAGSERQKASGAEGERLKEAANINKSLSTLGHVIMVLVDVAQGKPRHIPYRDSRLTFLLQDSLGGNSKTMIIANISPSICCAAETLNTLKFAQRAKLIQNNAVVNEDSSGDVTALQIQIRLLKEELSVLKCQNVSRSLSFGHLITEDSRQECGNTCDEKAHETDEQRADQLLARESTGNLRISSKQLKSLETTLAGALRREQMAETSIKRLEAEIEQLNRLVRQREEDTRCTKMMLKFREDKIQRMESLVGSLMPPDVYLMEENCALSEEIQLLRAKVDKNPEVTRFALENIRLLEQLRRFQDFYEEGEREMLLAEISDLRDQLVLCLDGNLKQHNYSMTNIQPLEPISMHKENKSLHLELDNTLKDLEECRCNLNCCLDNNSKLKREIDELHASLNALKLATDYHNSSVEVIKESILEAPSFNDKMVEEVLEDKIVVKHENLLKHTEEVLDLQLELDILKIIFKEEQLSHNEAEERAQNLHRDLELAKGTVLLITKKYEDVKDELAEAKLIIEALESQQIQSINETEELRNSNNHYAELLRQQELEISVLKKQIHCQELRDLSSLRHSESEEDLQAKLKKMQDSLEMAKRLNMWYQNDRAFQASNEEEMDEVRRQVEAETAEVIVCLQEELTVLQQQVQDSCLKEMETKEMLAQSQTELKELQEKLHLDTMDNRRLSEMLEQKEQELRTLTEEWELLIGEIEVVLTGGHEALEDAYDQLDVISTSFPKKRTWISGQLDRITKCILERDLMIEELNRCLEDVNIRRNDMECMLRSLRGAALVITEAHQQESSEKDEEILLLMSQLSAKMASVTELENRIKHGEMQFEKAALCATVAFVIMNRLSEIQDDHLDALKQKDVQLSESIEMNANKDALLSKQAALIDEAERQIQSLRMELGLSEEICDKLRMQLFEEQKRVSAMELKLEEIEGNNLLRTKEKLTELKNGVSVLRSSISEYAETDGSAEKGNVTRRLACSSVDGRCEAQTGSEGHAGKKNVTLYTVDDPEDDIQGIKMHGFSSEPNILAHGKIPKVATDRDNTIILLKKEIEAALESLNDVQAEMTRLRDEKDKVWNSEKRNREVIESVITEVLALQGATGKFEEQFRNKLVLLDHKLQRVQGVVPEAEYSWLQKQELFELELGDAKVIANQKTAEASCILAKFEEAQDTMKEADIMINELMIANETMKLELGGLKKTEAALINERDILTNKVQYLQSANSQKDLCNETLAKQFESDLMGMKKLVLEVEGMVSQAQSTLNEEFISIASAFLCIKSQLHDSTKLIRSWLEDIWSDIIVKDCALSVLHLCHMGILLETVTGLNAENGLLHRGLSASNSIVSELRKHNLKSRRELEICRILEGKLLTDIKSSFDRISKKEDETGEFADKLITFENKILDLQFQEELMLHRFNCMGSELVELMKDLDLNNTDVFISLLNQENLLNDKEELLESREEIFMVDLTAKDLELFILASELEQEVVKNANLERVQMKCFSVIDNFKHDIFFQSVDAQLKQQILLGVEVEIELLQNELEAARRMQHETLSDLRQNNLKISQLDQANKGLEQDIKLLKEVASSNDTLKGKLNDVVEENGQLSSQVWKLKSDYDKLLEDMKMKEAAFEISSNQITLLDQQNQMLQNDICLLERSSYKLQNELDLKAVELSKMNSIEDVNISLASEVSNLKAEYSVVLQNLEEKRSELESTSTSINVLSVENQSLQDKIVLLEDHIAKLQFELATVNQELSELQLNQSTVQDELCSRSHDLQIHADRVNTLEDKSISLRNELFSHAKNTCTVLATLHMNITKCVSSVETVDEVGSKLFNLLDEENVTVKIMFQEICKNVEHELNCLENLAKELISKNLSLQTELLRRDDVVEGLSFDLRLLQESASNTKDQNDEIDKLVASLEALENELAERSNELDEAVVKIQILESQLKEKTGIISTLELDISKERDLVNSLSQRNLELTSKIHDILEEKRSIEEELNEQKKVSECLETELLEMGTTLSQMNASLESLRSNLNSVTHDRDALCAEILTLKKELEMVQALAEENEAIVVEAQQEADMRKMYAEDKEEEVKLLERSVEELESTVNVLESKVEIVKGEAERQRLQREELELELHAVKQQMHNLESSDADLKRLIVEKEKNIQEVCQHMQILEKEIAARDVEIAQCKAHISELTLHAEAQACEYKQKFMELEAMAEQVKPDGLATQSSSANKLEKNGSRSRGSGSPFKCIGLGLAQQIKSERDEELTAARHRIEELEALTANRQKEIFMLNARLAAAESMTHDVIRDLLGVKLDMSNYATLVNDQLVLKITEKACLQNVEEVKDEEMIKLKQQLNEFVEERSAWLEEIDRKHAEMVTAQVALEKLRQRDRLLTTENDMLKLENARNKKKVMELEAVANKLSGQQNLQQRIHHHAKIKEENNSLKSQNEDLSSELWRTETILLRVKEELAHFRAANGRSPYINFDEEQRLNDRLKETEEERLQLAQKLVGLCTSILKAAGITRPISDVTLSVAEEVLEQLKNRVTSLERELQDVKFKNRIASERIRLSELMPQSSPLSSRTDENRQTPKRASHSPFLSPLDR